MAGTQQASNDFPFENVVEKADEQVRLGNFVFQKWTCSHCKSRQTMPKPNKFWLSGVCEECDSVTDIQKQGCNYTLIAGIDAETLKKMLREMYPDVEQDI